MEVNDEIGNGAGSRSVCISSAIVNSLVQFNSKTGLRWRCYVVDKNKTYLGLYA